MRLATFNVLHGLPEDAEERHDVPAAVVARRLAEAVSALDADVLALQELDRFQSRSGRTDQAAIAARASGARHWRYASAVHGDWPRATGRAADPGLRVSGPDDARASELPSHGVALVTRLPVRLWRARRLRASSVPFPLKVPGRSGLVLVRDQPRVALAAVLEGKHGPFTVVATHLSFVPGRNAAQLAAVHGWVADLPAPRILLGDFNLTGPVPRWVLAAAARLGGSDRPRGRQQAPWRDLSRLPTYPARRPLVRFDHVLANGVPREAVRGTAAPRSEISDHRPLVVDVAL
ncbi:endonuclease/exonuclease/phosphatase family protein [Streptomyces fructofermentans]|uniref:endonuclease/exonuclease/phosphatase family protein n=1 Tax=Streptomyces fructofermentans TaxID=152141 RepID=UPI0037A0AFD2